MKQKKGVYLAPESNVVEISGHPCMIGVSTLAVFASAPNETFGTEQYGSESASSWF